MAIKVMADSGGTVSYEAADIGAGFNVFASNKDFIIAGIDEEISVIYSATSLQIGINKGEAIICGRPVMINAIEQFTLPANQSTELNLVLRVDLTQPIGQEGLITYVSDGQIKADNLNNVNGQHDLILAKFKTNANGVSSFTDMRVILSNVSPVLPGGNISGTAGSGKTLTAFSQTDGQVNATFGNISITKSQVSDFAHTHGNITNVGDITTNVAIANGDRLVINDESASRINNSSITFGTSTSTFLANNGTWQTPAGNFKGINITNTPIATRIIRRANATSDVIDYTYTASQDCWMLLSLYAGRYATTKVYLDGYLLLDTVKSDSAAWAGGNDNKGITLIPLKNGQKVRIYNNTADETMVYGYRVYGVK